MSSAPTSTTSSGGNVSPRLSRMSSSSGAFSTQSLQGFRTVSLPGLFPGTHLGILASGLLDKRRDGAVRGGWAKRLFILSTRSLHYYRKVEESELFGKERGQVLLSDIGYAKVVMPRTPQQGLWSRSLVVLCWSAVGMISDVDEVESEQKRKTLLLFLRADSFEYASSWVSIVNNAVHTGKSVNFAPRWTVETMQTFISAASGNFEEIEAAATTESPTEVAAAPTVTRPTPTVLVVSMVSGPLSGLTTTERLVKRSVELNTELQLGPFEQKDTCVLVLSDGEELHIPQRLLGGDLQSLLTTSKQIELTTPLAVNRCGHTSCRCPKFSVRYPWLLSFRCVRAPPVQISRRDSGPQPVMSSLPSTFTVAFPGTLGGLFLISCLVSFYCATPFVGLMKITIILGLILSVSQITHLSEAQSQKRLSPVLSPIGGSRKAVAAVGNELVFLLTVDRMEVIEADQDKEPALSETASPVSDVDGVAETETNAISGGPIAFSPRFIAGEKGDEEKGRARYLATLEWRKENNIDNILVTPHPNFETIKKYYPQYFHGRTRDGLPVYYERPGKIDLPALKREGLSIDDLLRHYMYITEYLWRVVEPDDSGRSITVLDVTGIGMYDLGGEVLDFIKRASAFTGAHYPERSAHIFIINIPGWFNMIWRMVKPMIDPVTREKVHMLKGSAILKELETLIDLENIPSDFGGEGVALGDSDEEHALAAHWSRRWLLTLAFAMSLTKLLLRRTATSRARSSLPLATRAFSDVPDEPVYFEDISTASYRIRDGIQQTQCEYSPLLSQRMGIDLYLKKDHRQMTGSFKERGARNALLQLTDEEKKNGVVAASAGNHAQALAYHGQLLGIPVTCVMPKVAPLTKIARCRELGARVVLHGEHILEARDKAEDFVRDENMVYINGFDRPEIIAGAGTMGIEILNQVPDVDAIIVPVGGGGLIAGVALAVKTLSPKVQVIGVEPEYCSSFTEALKAGKPVNMPTQPTLADGLAVPCVGANAFEIARKYVDKVVTVSERSIALSVLRLVEMEKVVVEGGGASSLAALIDDKLPELKGKRVVLPLTGGNIDTPVLGRVIDRGLAADGRLVRFVATVSDRPGGIAQLTCFLRDFGVSVKDIYHERAWVHASISHVAVKCVVETQSSEHALKLKQRLEENGYPLIWESFAGHQTPAVEL
ncbi:PH domain-like [Phytophthora cactorum]|nr:PH domain-like [Phytophthora cactorum]